MGFSGQISPVLLYKYEELPFLTYNAAVACLEVVKLDILSNIYTFKQALNKVNFIQI